MVVLNYYVDGSLAQIYKEPDGRPIASVARQVQRSDAILDVVRLRVRCSTAAAVDRARQCSGRDFIGGWVTIHRQLGGVGGRVARDARGVGQVRLAGVERRVVWEVTGTVSLKVGLVLKDLIYKDCMRDTP